MGQALAQVLAVEVVAQGDEDLVRAGLGEQGDRVVQQPRLGLGAGRCIGPAIGGIPLEGGVGRIAVLGHPDRPVEAVVGEQRVPLGQPFGQLVQGVAQAQAQVHGRDVELPRGVGPGGGEHTLDPIVLPRTLDPAEHDLRLRRLLLDRAVGGTQHARVVLGAAEEGPAGVRLVEDLPVVDLPACVGGDLAG